MHVVLIYSLKEKKFCGFSVRCWKSNYKHKLISSSSWHTSTPHPSITEHSNRNHAGWRRLNFSLVYLLSHWNNYCFLPGTQTASKDSDSLIHESYQYSPSYFDPDRIWWKHPRVKENWKVVATAFALVIIGLGKHFISMKKLPSIK